MQRNLALPICLLLVAGCAPSPVRLGPEMRLNPGGYSDLPSQHNEIVLAACQERVYVVWQRLTEDADTADLVAQASADGARSWLPEEVRLDEDAPDRSVSAMASLRCAGDDAYVAWWRRDLQGEPGDAPPPPGKRKGDKAILVRRSGDGGRSWTPAVAVNTGFDAFIPSLALDGEGGVYVAYDDERTSAHSIWFNRSAEGGRSWLPQDVEIDKPFGIRGRGQSALEVRLVALPGGRVHAAWQDKDMGWSRPYYRGSEDRGATWQEAVTDLKIGDSVFAWPPELGADAEGRVYVVHGAVEGDRKSDIYFAASYDNGKSWTLPPARLDEGEPFQSDSARHALAHDGRGALCVVWEESAWGEPNIVARRSGDAGRSWGPVVRLDGGTAGLSESHYPQIAADGQGGLAVVWEDMRENILRVYANVSTDGGQSWLPEALPVSGPGPETGGSLRPKVTAVGPGRFLVAWMDTRFLPERAQGLDVYARVVELRKGR